MRIFIQTADGQIHKLAEAEMTSEQRRFVIGWRKSQLRTEVAYGEVPKAASYLNYDEVADLFPNPERYEVVSVDYVKRLIESLRRRQGIGGRRSAGQRLNEIVILNDETWNAMPETSSEVPLMEVFAILNAAKSKYPILSLV